MGRYLIIVTVSLSIIWGCRMDNNLSISENHISHNTTHLITCAEVNELLMRGDTSIVILQVTPPEIYATGHLPGAQQVWREAYGCTIDSIQGMIGSRTQIEALLRKSGLEKDDTLILYDNKGSVDACRLAWVLHYYGMDNYKIMDGGLKHWTQHNFPVETQAYNARPSEFRLQSKMNQDISASYSEVLAATLDTHTVILDTRKAFEFYGKPYIHKDKILGCKTGAFAHGCIPGSIHFNWSNFVDLSGTHLIKAKEDLIYDLDKAGITPEKNIIVYCQSGSRSAHTYFVLKEILEFPNVKNYDGSWIEWSYKHSRDSTVRISQLTSRDSIDKIYAALNIELSKQ